MTSERDSPGPGPSALVAAVLDEEARRGLAPGTPSDDAAGLPGVGGAAPPLREVLANGGWRLLLTLGATWGLGFAIFGMAAVLALKIAHGYDFSLRFLVQVAILPGFTI